MFAWSSHEFTSSHKSIFLPLPTLFWYMLPFICRADNDRLTVLCIACCKLRLSPIKLMRKFFPFFFWNFSHAPYRAFTSQNLYASKLFTYDALTDKIYIQIVWLCSLSLCHFKIHRQMGWRWKWHRAHATLNSDFMLDMYGYVNHSTTSITKYSIFSSVV